jgi:hypothetical protein
MHYSYPLEGVMGVLGQLKSSKNNQCKQRLCRVKSAEPTAHGFWQIGDSSVFELAETQGIVSLRIGLYLYIWMRLNQLLQ